ELAKAWFRGDPAVSGYRRSADLRVTRAGRYLRSADIDELPQLLNVLRGEMSLVGPRPGIPYELQYYKPSHYERLRVKPGITGPCWASWRAAPRLSCSRRYMPPPRSSWSIPGSPVTAISTSTSRTTSCWASTS